MKHREIIKERESQFFEKINKIDKFLARWQSIMKEDEIGAIATDHAYIKKIRKLINNSIYINWTTYMERTNPSTNTNHHNSPNWKHVI